MLNEARTAFANVDPTDRQAEALNAYHEHLGQLNGAHSLALETIDEAHGNGIAAWEPGNDEVEGIVVRTSKDVDEVLGSTAGEAEKTLQTWSERLAGTLEADDEGALEDARRFAMSYGVQDTMVGERLGSISDPVARSIANAALDIERLKNARRVGGEYGMQDERIQAIIDGSSDPSARTMVSTGLDKARLEDIRRLRPVSIEHTPDRERIDAILNGSSSPLARRAIEIALERTDLEIARMARGDFDPFELRNWRTILTFGVDWKRHNRKN